MAREMDGKIALNLDEQEASALYMLLDTALSSLIAQQAALGFMINKQIPVSEEFKNLDLDELSRSLDVLIKDGKNLAVSTGTLVLEFDKAKKPFEPFVKGQP